MTPPPPMTGALPLCGLRKGEELDLAILVVDLLPLGLDAGRARAVVGSGRRRGRVVAVTGAARIGRAIALVAAGGESDGKPGRQAEREDDLVQRGSLVVPSCNGRAWEGVPDPVDKRCFQNAVTGNGPAADLVFPKQSARPLPVIGV